MSKLDNQLPSSWHQSTLEDISEIHDNLREPVNASERSKRHGSYPYYGATGQVGWINDFRQDGEFILLGEDGAPFFDWIKEKAYLVNGKCWVNNHAHVLKGKVNLCLNRYLLHALNQTDYRGYANGTTRLKLTQSAMKQILINLAPFAEQHRIVAKIEELFSELDKGIESLKTARAQLKVYRQALLKHAFEGKLTADWREQNNGELETAAAVQQRIQTERAARHQQQVTDWQAAGQKGSKPKATKSLPPLTNVELAELPELVDSWTWVKFGQVFDIYVGSTPTRKREDYWNGNIAWVSSGEVAFCKIKDTKEKITKSGYASASTEIHPVGTILLAMIGEGKTRGQPAILDIEACHNQNTAAIRVVDTGFPSEYLYQYLAYQYEITRRIGSGNNQKALNKARVSDMTIPLCTSSEMLAVVNSIDEKLSIANQLDQTITTTLQQSEALRQSILIKAFSGALVSQDVNDEPASVLLARIKAEKTALAPAKHKKPLEMNRSLKVNP